ncbi:hypothetical protein GS676_24345 [Rhodococcus hoagii]|nr:hypothetical protein [Prescottella equi]
MISKARLLLTGLAAVAIVLIVGGVVFDRRETRDYEQCMDVMRALRDVPPLPVDPEVVSVSLVRACEDANRVGLAVAGIGAVLLAAAVIVWWARRRAARSEWE